MVCALALVSLQPCYSKYPSWSGPDIFLDGTLPFNRSLHGFTLADDGRIYVFGGQGTQGDSMDAPTAD